MPLKLTGSLEYDCEEVGCLISKCLCGIGIFSSAFGWRGDDGLLATSCLHYSSTPSSCTSPFSFLCVLLRLQRRRAVSFGPFLLAGVVSLPRATSSAPSKQRCSCTDSRSALCHLYNFPSRRLGAEDWESRGTTYGARGRLADLPLSSAAGVVVLRSISLFLAARQDGEEQEQGEH